MLSLRSLRILLVSQMYPGPADPDLGVFVRQLELALRERGHEIELAVLDRRAGGKRRFLELRRKVRAARAARRRLGALPRPVGADRRRRSTRRSSSPRTAATSATSARCPGIAALTRRVVERASTVIAVSDYLRRELELKLPEARGKTVVIDSGVDLERVRGRAGGRRGASGRRSSPSAA